MDAIRTAPQLIEVDGDANVNTITGGESRRIAVLRETGVLDTLREECFDVLVRSAALLTGCPIAMMSMSDASRQWLKSAYGLTATQIPRRFSFCDGAAAPKALLVVADARNDPRFAGHAMVTGAPWARCYAGVPLYLEDAVLGTLCVVDTVPRALDSAQLEALSVLAQSVCELIQVRQQLGRLDGERRRLLDFAAASGDWMWETDAALRFIWISGAFEAITGEATAAVLGTRLEDTPRLDGFGQPRSDGSTLADLMTAGLAFARVLVERRTPRGRLIVSYSAVPVHGDVGQLTGWRGTARDVTLPVERACRQRAQNQLIEQISNQVPGVIFQFRRPTAGVGHYDFISEQVSELFGITAAEAMADANRLFAVMHPDDHARFRDGVLDRERDPGPMEIEYRVRRADGTEHWMNSSAVCQRQADGVVVWRGFVADVTERKQTELALRDAEERWSLVAAATGIGITEFDVASGRLTLDARACANHGIAYPHPPMGLDDWIASIHAEDRAAAAEQLRHVIAHGCRFETRCRFVRPDGLVSWLEIVCRLDPDGQGRPAMMTGTCRDVTEQMAVEALRREKDAAERASRAKTEFLSRVSHELRTPLNGILGFAQLMALDRDHALGEEQQRRLDGVKRSGEHLLALVNDVLDLARIESVDFRPALRPVNVVDVALACRQIVRPLAARHGVRVQERLPEACWVRADTRALEQALINLLTNAIRFNRVGGIVRLDAELVDGRATIGVEDEGPVLSAEQRAQLFEPFNRFGAERWRGEGDGLGLVIARELVRAMGGELGVVSGVGPQGSRFIISLATASAPADGVGATPAPADAATPERIDVPERHVLYIEDEPLNIVLMEEVFRLQTGWTLHSARDGAEGLQLAHALLPDLLLIDINLPDTTGIELIRRLRAAPDTAGLHCIALSADAMQEQVNAALGAGFDDYWTKPINVAQLMRTLAAALARGRPAT